MNHGLLSVVTVAGAVSTAVLWGMTASDPYWRLIEAPNVPAPTYQAAAEQRAFLATLPQDFGNTDAGAINPATEAPPNTANARMAFGSVARRSDNASTPAPMAALAPPLVPQLMIGPESDTMVAYEMPRVAIPIPTNLASATDLTPESGNIVARAPVSLPGPLALRDGDAGVVAQAVSKRSLDLFIVPDSPVQPRIAASADTEEALAMKRNERIEVQRRLTLAGFNPNGLDGVFGDRTSGAIADFQTAWGYPATGFLDTSVYAYLNQRTEYAYQALRRQAAAAPSAAPDLAPAARERE
jgi:hypothetical protein